MKHRFWLMGALALAVLGLAGLPTHPGAARAGRQPGPVSPAATVRAVVDQGGVGGVIEGVVVDQGRAYVAQSAGLSVFDVSAPERPALLTQTGLPWTPEGLGAADGFAYTFVQGSNLMAIIDLRTPGQSQIVKTLPFGAPLRSGLVRDRRAFALHGGYLYLASSGYPLTVVDVHDPLRPSPAGSVSVPGFDNPRAIRIAGARAYILGTDSEGPALFAFDLRQPSAPSLKGTLALEREPTDLAIAGSSVAVTDYDGVSLIDASDPARLAKGARLDLDHGAAAVTAEGRRAYLLSSEGPYGPSNSLTVVDIQSPAALTPVGRIDIPGQDTAVPVVGGLAYAANSSGRPVGLRVLDVRNPAQPLTRGVARLVGQLRELRAAGRQVLALEEDIEGAALWSLEASGPDALQLRGVLELDGAPRALASSGPFAYAALGSGTPVTPTSTIRVIDLTSPINPTARGSLTLAGWVTDTRLVSSTLFVLDRESLRVVDVSQPDQPVLRGSLKLPGDPVALAVAGSRVYALGLQLQVIEISDLDQPVLLGSIQAIPSTTFADLAVIGNWVFVGHGAALSGGNVSGSISVYDVSAPAAPRHSSRLALSGTVSGLVVRGDQLLAGGGAGLWIVDASDPTQLRLQRDVWGAQGFEDLDEAGGQVYGLSQGGLRTIKPLDRQIWLPQIQHGSLSEQLGEGRALPEIPHPLLARIGPSLLWDLR